MTNGERRLAMIYAGHVTYSIEYVPRSRIRPDPYLCFVVWSRGKRSPTADEALALAWR